MIRKWCFIFHTTYHITIFVEYEVQEILYTMNVKISFKH